MEVAETAASESASEIGLTLAPFEHVAAHELPARFEAAWTRYHHIRTESHLAAGS